MVNPKPSKPRKDFPLYAHSSGQWAKKINQRVYYFGPWANPQAALDKYLDEKDNILAGRPRAGKPTPTTTTVSDVLEAFYEDKEGAYETGDINERTLGEYKGICRIIGDTLGDDTPIDSVSFNDLSRLRRKLGRGKSGKAVSPVTHKRLLTFARMIFSFANDEQGANVRYKKALKTPAARIIRKARNEVGERLFTADQVRQLITATDPELQAMVLLGINAGFGPKDCYTLPIKAVDLDGGWISYERPKTGAPRRCPLWAESVKALKAVIGDRKTGLVFSKYDNRQVWNRHIVGRAFKTLVEGFGFYQDKITTFYSLRRSFETVASAGDVSQPVIDLIMGHPPRTGDMAAVYRQKVYDEQLRKCVEHIRGWVLGTVVLS
jgi:integrase